MRKHRTLSNTQLKWWLFSFSAVCVRRACAHKNLQTCVLASVHRCVYACMKVCVFECARVCWGKWANLSVYPDHVHTRCCRCFNEEHIWADITSTCRGDGRGPVRIQTVLIQQHTHGHTLTLLFLLYSILIIVEKVMGVIGRLPQQYREKKTLIYSPDSPACTVLTANWFITQ